MNKNVQTDLTLTDFDKNGSGKATVLSTRELFFAMTLIAVCIWAFQSDFTLKGTLYFFVVYLIGWKILQQKLRRYVKFTAFLLFSVAFCPVLLMYNTQEEIEFLKRMHYQLDGSGIYYVIVYLPIPILGFFVKCFAWSKLTGKTYTIFAIVEVFVTQMIWSSVVWQWAARKTLEL